MSIKQTKDGVVLTVFVKPKSSKFSIRIEGSQIIINCTQEPVKGRVNKEIIKELTKLFHAKAEITSGFTSKEKQITLIDIGRNQAEQIVNASVTKI